ncbi:MAG TPA: carotenoid biosynthesis protein [Chloroflexia bacterium]|nr:carotenoid biosynthesis protein [Chloroflexia bacterium]
MTLSKTNRFLMLIFFSVYCFIYPSSLFLLMTDRVPAGTEWMASLMLVLEGLVAMAWVMLNYGPWRGFTAALAVLSGAFAVETIGVKTGFPFGQYEYTDVLSPKLLVVPVGIMFAWLMMILSSFFTARYIVHRLWPRRGLGAIILLSAALTCSSDLLMEPVAVHIQGYWTWLENGSYYGVPISNFVAWGVTSLLLALVLTGLIGQETREANKSTRLNFMFIPIALYMMNLLMFAAINLTHNNLLAGMIGIAALVACGLALLRARQIELNLTIKHKELKENV